MFEAYKVGVTLSLTNKVSAGLLVVGKDLAKTQGTVVALQKKLDDLKTTGKKAAYELGAAFAIISPFALAITDAAKLQKEMIGIRQETGATTKQLDSMRMAIEKSAGQTMFSVIDVAKMGKTLGTGTLTPDQITSLLPEFAKFADVQLLLKGTPAQQSVKDAFALAHNAGYNTPREVSDYLNLLNKTSMVVPGPLSEVAHALKYSQSVMKNVMGMNDVDLLELTALLGQIGFKGSRGGTNLVAAATRSIPGIFGSGLLHGKSRTALTDMHMTDAHGHATFFENGKFSSHLWIEGMAKFVADTFKKMPEAEARQYILKHFQDSLGTNGARLGTLLATPLALAQLQKIDEKFKLLPSVDATQNAFATESVTQGFENAKTNFTSLMTELGYPLLPDVDTGLKGLNGTLQDMILSVHNNPDAVRKLTYAFAGLAGSLAIVGAVNLLKFALGSLVTPLRLIFGSLTTLLLANPVVLVSAMVIGTAYAIMHWKTIGPKVHSLLAEVGKLADPIWKGLADLGNSIRSAVVNFLAEVGNGILGGVQAAGKYVGDHEFTPTTSHSFGNNRGYSPPPSGNQGNITINNMIDPEKNTTSVINRATGRMSKATSPSSDYFDYRSTPGLAGGW